MTTIKVFTKHGDCDLNFDSIDAGRAALKVIRTRFSQATTALDLLQIEDDSGQIVLLKAGDIISFKLQS